MKVSKHLAKLAAQELERRRLARAPIFDESFAEQKAFILDPSKYVAAQTTVRAGKTTGLAYKFFNASRKYKRVMLPYISLTRDSAKNIMWPVLQEVAERYKILCDFTESDLTCTLKDTESSIKLFGADMKNFMVRLKGIKTPLAAIDEAQDFRSHIEELVDILTARISDYPEGQIALTGTPGKIPKGYFFEVSNGLHGFNLHKWQLFDNPYMPGARKHVEDLLQRKGWTWQTPTIRREYLGEWVPDNDALVYKYNEALNNIDRLPTRSDWYYVLGVDLGFDPDPSAFTLSCFSHHDPCMYIIETYKQNGMTVSDVAERIKYYMKGRPGLKIVIDAGALGKMIAEEIKQRHQIPVIAAEKTGKAGFIELMNSDMQKGYVKIVGNCAPDLVDEWMNLQWDTNKTERVEDSRYPNHNADAALYNWRWNYHYAARPEEIAPKPNSEEELDAFWDQEEERLQNLRQLERDLYG